VVDWRREEAGWYVADGVGGIVNEGPGYGPRGRGSHPGGWYFYPEHSGQFGPFSTLAKAEAFAATHLLAREETR